MSCDALRQCLEAVQEHLNRVAQQTTVGANRKSKKARPRQAEQVHYFRSSLLYKIHCFQDDAEVDDDDVREQLRATVIQLCRLLRIVDIQRLKQDTFLLRYTCNTLKSLLRVRVSLFLSFS